MKGIVAFTALGLLASSQSFGVLLVDGGMNSVGSNGQLGSTPNAPWVVHAERGANTNFDDGAASEAFADTDGGGFGIFFKSFIGNPPWDPTAGLLDVVLYQDVAGTPGVQYTLKGWWGAEDNWSGFHTPGANAIFALDFFGPGNALLGSAELDLEAAGLGDPGLPGLNYEEFSVSAVAPAGTVDVRARGSVIDTAFYQDPGQALVTDEWTLTSNQVGRGVPEPLTAGLGVMGLAALALSATRRRAS